MFGDGASLFASPGRVNLIGEHTDYNLGFVLPGAIDKAIYVALKPNDGTVCRVHSLDYDETVELDLHGEKPSQQWACYVYGVCQEMEKRGALILPFDMAFGGDVPLGAGLSSSAALESAVGFALNETYGLGFDREQLAKIGQMTEHNYVGVRCGIMDQFAVAMGKKDNAIFLDTNTMKYEYAPIVLEDAKIIITNSKVKHSLVDSAYNDRRQECADALAALQTELDIKALGDLTPEKFEEHKALIKDPIQLKRAKHAVYENQRTIDAVAALREGNITKFGELMNQSHVSLRDDYEVSCEEIDILVDLAWKIPGVIGSRITGGGFGGCTVSIVKNSAVDTFIDSIGKAYQEKVGHEAEFYTVDIGDGASRIEE